MRIAYVLPEAVLSGGNKVVFQHAQLLNEAGHQVTVLGRGFQPGWSAFGGTYLDYSAASPSLPPQDLVIATYWTTIARARQLNLGPLAHFCQGYEGDLVHLASERPRIEAAYAHRLPTLVVAPHLAQRLERQFGREAFVTPPPLDPAFRPHRWRRRPRTRPWVMVPGIFEARVKGIPTALRTVALLQRRGVACRLLRVSTRPLSAAERTLMEPDRYLCHVSPKRVARTLRRCDLLLFPSRAAEGFGLPLLEAMTSQVPAVASRIPATEFMTAGAVPLVDPHSEAAFADAAYHLLSSPDRWNHARQQGYEAAQRFHPNTIQEQLLAGVEWAREQALHSAPSM